ncbi:hypothetical protein [Catenuloplanes atrovinosus]|uniref:Uncharacterized protein n=1 Tax=Catenuloplanes atrovinosus TaxID=137266 RepID=A0AAE3YKT2_9ACTN|nr:hypothetical protein [Catenuloplanes atrovinosus]MDR7274255.1 hypothetical protein [Catenuloplanes atrovinosus]
MADTCRTAAAGIGAQLELLRGHLAGLDPARLGMSAAQLRALLAGYDIYVRMLDDAIEDIAGSVRRPAGPRRSDVELAGGESR